MSFTSIKIKWAQKLLKAKFFVVLTDKEAVIAIDGADPRSFTDLMALSSQTAEIEMFLDKLMLLSKDHKAAVDKLTDVGGDSEGTVTVNPKKAKSSKAPK